MIQCGWCGQPTRPERCDACLHERPEAPWVHRGLTPPEFKVVAGRPVLDEHAIRRRWREARGLLGPEATLEQLAEHLDRSPRTVREWRKRYGLR